MARRSGLLVVAAVAVGAFVASRMGGDSSSGPKRTPVPEGWTPPPSPYPPTSQMMTPPAGVVPVPPIPGENRRRYIYEKVKVPRSDTVNPWPIFTSSDALLPSTKFVSVRVWIAADWAPAKGPGDDDGESIDACGQWVFAGAATQGAKLPRTMNGQKIGCFQSPSEWLVVRASVDVAGRVVVRATYPGKGHTGSYRGIEYQVVIDVVELEYKPPQ